MGGRPHPLQQGVHLAGLREVVRRAQLQRLGSRPVAEVPGEHDGLGRPQLRQAAQDPKAVQPRQHRVQDQQVGLLLLRQAQRLQPVPRGAHHRELPGLPDRARKKGAKFFIGIRQQYLCRILHLPFPDLPQ